jgi:hypothetical protein
MIAGEMAKAGMTERAEEVFEKALQVAEEGIGGAWCGGGQEALREIAGEMAKAGMFDQALKRRKGLKGHGSGHQHWE